MQNKDILESLNKINIRIDKAEEDAQRANDELRNTVDDSIKSNRHEYSYMLERCRLVSAEVDKLEKYALIFIAALIAIELVAFVVR